MKRSPLTVALLLLSLSSGWGNAEEKQIQATDIRPQIQAILPDLSNLTGRFETIQEGIDKFFESRKISDEQRRILLSSVLAIATISDVCEHEHDQLSLFIELSDEHRRRNTELRATSLGISVKQIENLYDQIQINRTLLPSGFFGPVFIDRIHKTIRSALSLLESARELTAGPQNVSKE